MQSEIILPKQWMRDHFFFSQLQLGTEPLGFRNKRKLTWDMGNPPRQYAAAVESGRDSLQSPHIQIGVVIFVDRTLLTPSSSLLHGQTKRQTL